MNDDAQLLRRYAEERDEAAFAELVQRHLSLVYGAALRQLGGAAHRAQDVTQSVFIDLARKAGSLAGRTELAGWLYTSTHFAAAKLKRTEQRRQLREQEAHTMQQLLSGSSADPDWERLRPVLDDAMHDLAERDRDVIFQRFFQGRRLAELGAALGLSEDAARMRVDRALDKLRALLARRQVTSTVAALAVALANQPVAAVPAGFAATVTSTALASASAAAASPLATFLHFMTTSKLMTGVAGIALLAALGTAVNESRARQTAADTLVATSTDLAKLDGRLRDAQQRATAAEQALNEARASLAAAEAPAPRPATPPPPTPGGSAADALQAGRDFLAQHPEARQLWDERERASMAARLAPIYRLMNLSEAEQEKIGTLFLNASGAMTTFGTPNGMVALQRESKLTRPEAEAQLQELLGAERYARFQTLSLVAPTFDFTGKLASALYRVEPLSSAQSERMMKIFAAASPVGKPIAPGTRPTIDWTAITTEAGAVLSPAQLTALTAVQRNFEYNQAVQKIVEPVKSAPPPTR